LETFDVYTESELLEVKVPMVFLGTVGFSPRRDGRYSISSIRKDTNYKTVYDYIGGGASIALYSFSCNREFHYNIPILYNVAILIPSSAFYTENRIRICPGL
jgi:hypothetical protein